MLNIGIAYPPIDEEIVTLVDRFEKRPEAILEIFQTLQDRYGGVTDEQIRDVARAIGVPSEQAYGVASFYTLISTPPEPRKHIRVCDGPPCWLAGSQAVHAAAEQDLSEDWVVERTSCLGLCDRAPAALVAGEQCGPLTPDRVQAASEGWRGSPRTYPDPLPGEVRVLLRHAGEIDPRSLDSALEHAAYAGLRRALSMRPEEVVEEVVQSGLRGRGGAGFPAGHKWRYVAMQTRSPKYIVCNADESEPLVFKDRVLMDTHPHQVLEGMAIAAYAVGASEGYIYIRGEYERQAQLLEHAIEQAVEAGFLGENILDSDFSFHIHVHRGAGAYICGEETALLESMEGKRGEPRVRPPYPTVYGYHGMPTVVNNVETLAMAPRVLENGAEAYLQIGNPEVPGTKVYTLLGHVNRPGLFEAGYGLTLRTIIEEFGQGMPEGSEFAFALCGGAAGTIVPESHLDIPIQYTTAEQEVPLGAGAFMIFDHTVPPVELVAELLGFFEAESCGKCTPCRIGTLQARQILERIAGGEEDPALSGHLLTLADTLEDDSLCGLGQSAAWPIRSAIEHFPDAFSYEPLESER